MTPFSALAELADRLASEASRLKKRAAIVAALEAIHRNAPASPDAGLFALYLSGQPFAEADTRKLNTGGALLSRAVQTITQASDAALTAAYCRHGDLGAAAFDLWPADSAATDSQDRLTLTAVATAFDAMATARTTAVRSATVESLLRSATPLEAKYLFKLMLGDLRIGVKQALIEEAIALAAAAELTAVRHAVTLEADLVGVTARAFAGTLSEARLRLFHPLGFMLASPLETPEEAVTRFTAKPIAPEPAVSKPKRRKVALTPEEVAPEAGAPEESAPEVAVALITEPPPIHAYLEDKYDGMRAQLHCGDPAQPGRVALYSRNREEITASFPELAEAFAHADATGIGPLILDGEILGWNLALDTALPFAVLGQRIGRKRVDDTLRRQVPVIFMAFDLLCATAAAGTPELLLDRPLHERRARLQAVVERLLPVTLAPLAAPVPQHSLFTTLSAAGEEPLIPPIQRLRLSPARLVESAEAIDIAYAEARSRANEGVMIKAGGSAYQPGRRGISWDKLKRELATLDVVITGAEFGHGRRAGLLSDYTFAVQRPGVRPGDPAELLNVGKAYSGVTDAEIAELTAWLRDHTLEDRGHFRTVEPLRVLEVAFNNIMRSERHASGFALRFPRILRIRDDKPLNEIDTLARVEELYQSQPDKPADAAPLETEEG